jgi:hypothetical protein
VDGDAGGAGLKIGDGPEAGLEGKKKDTWLKRHPAVHHRLSALAIDVQGAAGKWVSLFTMRELALADPTLSAFVASVNLKKMQLGMIVNGRHYSSAANEVARYGDMGLTTQLESEAQVIHDIGGLTLSL